MAMAILNGTLIDDGGFVCEVRFEYGLTPAYGTTTLWRAGYWTGMTFQERIYNLPGGVIVFFRAVARNVMGTNYGAQRMFLTIPRSPIVATNPATGISTMAAVLNGLLVDDMGAGCQARFEYGGSSALGLTTRWVSGYVSGSVFASTVADLSPGQPCYFRAVAENRYGRGYGAIMSLTTLSEQGPRSGFPMELLLLTED